MRIRATQNPAVSHLDTSPQTVVQGTNAFKSGFWMAGHCGATFHQRLQPIVPANPEPPAYSNANVTGRGRKPSFPRPPSKRHTGTRLPLTWQSFTPRAPHLLEHKVYSWGVWEAAISQEPEQSGRGALLSPLLPGLPSGKISLGLITSKNWAPGGQVKPGASCKVLPKAETKYWFQRGWACDPTATRGSGK